MAPAYVIRPATSDDVGFLADVVVAAINAQGRRPPDFDEQEWRKGYVQWTEWQVRGSLEGNTTSVIELDGERVGRLRVLRSGECVELAGIQLDPLAQGRGIGTAIIESLKAEATAAGLPMELGVEFDNPNARRLYERLGFVEVGKNDSEFRLRWSPEMPEGAVDVFQEPHGQR
jgi:GNAT superfamily N-acetyltransferase